VFGAHGDVRSPLQPPTVATLLDVQLAAGARLVHRPPPGEPRFCYVIEGEVQVGPVDAPTVLRTGDVAGFSDLGDEVTVSATARAAHVVIAGGLPIREPAVFYGPFCMNTSADIQRAITAYKGGAMGHLAPSF
jgi:redox-sensitive bicupin YhaK (pirin superfamily)